MNLKRFKRLRLKDLLDGRKFNTHTIGISHIVLTKRKKKGVQFYDIDAKDLSIETIETILSFYPNDCLSFKTKKGLHFLSFTIIKRKKALKRAKKLSKILNEHYALTNQLVLRIGSKISNHKIIAQKPKFETVYKLPKENSDISFNHLFSYFEVNGLPLNIFKYYIEKTNLRDYGITYHYYKTRGYEIEQKV